MISEKEKASELVDMYFGYANQEASTNENYSEQIERAKRCALVDASNSIFLINNIYHDVLVNIEDSTLDNVVSLLKSKEKYWRKVHDEIKKIDFTKVK